MEEPSAYAYTQCLTLQASASWQVRTQGGHRLPMLKPQYAVFFWMWTLKGDMREKACNKCYFLSRCNNSSGLKKLSRV